MAFTDWEIIGETKKINQSEKHSFEGGHSLYIKNTRDLSTFSAVVLSKSIDESPREGQVVTRVLNRGGPDKMNTFGAVFRYQNENNFYAIDSRAFMDDTFGSTDDGDDDGYTNIGLFKRTSSDDGTTVTEETVDTVNMEQSFEQNGGPQWGQFRCSMFRSDGELHFRPEYRPSEDSGWVRYNEQTDLVDTEPDLSQGGGIGLTFSSLSGALSERGEYGGDSTDTRGPINFDSTKILYSK
jgi:hypothetical protein